MPFIVVVANKKLKIIFAIAALGSVKGGGEGRGAASFHFAN